MFQRLQALKDFFLRTFNPLQGFHDSGYKLLSLIFDLRQVNAHRLHQHRQTSGRGHVAHRSASARARQARIG